MRDKKVRFQVRSILSLVALPLAAIGLTLAGCSGSFNNNLANGDSGVFFSADQPVGAGVARNFIELNNGIPVRMGMEFTPSALNNLPVLAPDEVASAYISPLPSKTHGTPFTNVLAGYVSSHPATVEPAHFHLAFLIKPLQTTAPPFTLEFAPPLLVEVPNGVIRSTDAANPFGLIVPGAGAIYDDPTKPAGKPAATTIGQNFFYFAGHLNGITLGPTVAEMKSKTSITMDILQPEFYPQDGFYPHSWKVRFDATRGTHVVELTNFKRAGRVIPPGT